MTKQNPVNTPESKPAIDWIKVEVQYRAGVRSLENIGQEFRVTKGRISQVAKKNGWTRDLGARIRSQADAKVQAAAANETLNRPYKEAAEAEVVEVNAVLQANTILAQRKDVARAMTLVTGLFGELEDQKEKLALAVRIDGARKLVETLKTAVVLQRQVLNIADDTPVDPGARVAEAVENGIEGLRSAFNQKLGRA